MTTTPAVGQTVHFTDHINHGGGHVRCFDAEVTHVNPDGSIDIDEILPGATTPAYAVVEQGKPGDLHTWHWPEDVAAAEEAGVHWSEAVSWHPYTPTDVGAVAPAVGGPTEEASSTSAPTSSTEGDAKSVVFKNGWDHGYAQGVADLRAERPYPYPEGDVIVLGPETFKASDGSVISHKGENYYPTSVVITSSEVGEGTHPAEPTEGERETNRLLHHITGGDFL